MMSVGSGIPYSGFGTWRRIDVFHDLYEAEFPVVRYPPYRLFNAYNLCCITDMVIVLHWLALQIYDPEMWWDKVVPQDATDVPWGSPWGICHRRYLDNSGHDRWYRIQDPARLAGPVQRPDLQGRYIMRINFHGRLVDEKEIRTGFIGCGSHSSRNIYPTFQYAPVNLVATCDFSIEKAQAFAAKFGARNYYSNYKEMLEKEDLDAVFVVTGYDKNGKPTYPGIAIDCLSSGRHVWVEKPPASSCAEIERMQEAAQKNGKNVVVGMKKMFFPANEKAKELMSTDKFGDTSLVMFQYPQYIPTQSEFDQYIRKGERVGQVVGFLDHLCHPASLMVYLMGMPDTLYYERSSQGAGVATFSFKSGAVASLAHTRGASGNGGMERTVIISNSGKHIVVDNNIRVSYHRTPPPEPGTGYGSSPNFYTGTTEQTTAIWEPEFSLGQLYNKGLFLLGYYNEVNEFARSIIENRPPKKGTLEQAWQVTRIFETYAEGPRKLVSLM